jgi:hypothetical protein
MVELIAGAVRAGTPELAAEAHRRLSDMTQASATDWGLGIAARSRALLTAGAGAESLYLEAIERLGVAGQKVVDSHLESGVQQSSGRALGLAGSVGIP